MTETIAVGRAMFSRLTAHHLWVSACRNVSSHTLRAPVHEHDKASPAYRRSATW